VYELGNGGWYGAGNICQLVELKVFEIGQVADFSRDFTRKVARKNS
jgi:hypothetical protein